MTIHSIEIVVLFSVQRAPKLAPRRSNHGLISRRDRVGKKRRLFLPATFHPPLAAPFPAALVVLRLTSGISLCESPLASGSKKQRSTLPRSAKRQPESRRALSSQSKAVVIDRFSLTSFFFDLIHLL